MDEYLSWSTPVNQVCAKLVKATAIFSKTLFALPSFISFSYMCAAWSQFIDSSSRVNITQRNAICIVCFASYNSTIHEMKL